MEFYPLHPQPTSIDIISTAGAVPITNEKGEVSMQKVKVHRYVSGKRPEYAPISSSDEESEDDDFIEARRHAVASAAAQGDASPLAREEESEAESLPDDPRLRRLMNRQPESEDEEDITQARIHRHRQIHEPEILDDEEEEEEMVGIPRGRIDSSEEEEEEELSDTEIERRRHQLKAKVLATKPSQEVEVLDKEDEGQSEAESEEESSEYEEYSDSDAEESIRLKPVFVRKKERVTLFEKEKEVIKKKEAEIESKKMAEERKKQTLRMIEEEIRKEVAGSKKVGAEEGNLNDVNTEDENDEVEYEAWKQRELKRIKRDREEREQLEKERLEIERLHTMTEDERRNEYRNNPKLVTNKAVKGKYKFMQKYYHRGAFYMDRDDEIYKRDFSEATLEDHFDKTILPRVMQVKNFGRSGRTKYTHLVDQDTTQFDSPWVSDTAQNIKFHNNQAAGCKQVFDRPSKKRK